MYVERRALRDLPKDAIILSEDEVLDHYFQHIFGTNHLNNIYPLKYGSVVAGGTVFASNYWIVNYYRSRLKLKSFPMKLFLSGTVVAIPATLAAVCHFKYCVGPILLEKKCTSCVHVEALFLQNLFGVFYAIVPSPFIALGIASVSLTYPVPGFTSKQEVKETFQVYQKFTKRIIPRILLCFLINSAIITLITWSEFTSGVNLRTTLQQQEMKLREIAEDFANKVN